MKKASDTLIKKIIKKTSSRSSYYDKSGNTVNKNITRVCDHKGLTFGQAKLSSAGESFDNKAI